MFPKEISDIIIKYNSSNDELSTINAAIDELIYQFNSINGNIKERINCLLTTVDTTAEEEKLFHDSKILREYISTLSLIMDDNEPKILNQRPRYNDNTDLYICYDNVCPACNSKMEEVNTQYTKIGFNGNTKGNLTIQKCPNCNRKFVIDYDLDGIDIDYTNIILHRDYCIKDELNFSDVIVLTTVASCSSKGHNITDIEAKIPIIEMNGSINYISKNVAYCRECNHYIMLKSDFMDLDTVIACKVIDQTIPYESSKTGDEIEIKQKQSVLYQYGYNVKAKDKLTDKQRHLILAMVVESEILTRSQISSHLDTLIERGSKIPNWKEATEKWKQDRNYVSKYKSENLPKIVTEKLILRYSVKKDRSHIE